MTNNGFYRASSPEVSTSDWVSLNFPSYSTGLFNTLAEYNPDSMCHLERVMDTPPDVDEPEEDDFDSEEEYEEARTAFEEVYEAWEEEQHSLNAWPVSWGTMWGCDSNSGVQEALLACGFVVYDTSGEMQDFGECVFGIDGGGYNFYAAHWIPLRATLLAGMHSKDLITDENFHSFIEVLSLEQAASGGCSAEAFVAQFTAKEAA